MNTGNRGRGTFARQAAWLALYAAMACGLVSCSRQGAGSQEQPKKKPPLVSVAVARTGPIARVVELPGTVRPDITANVLAPAEGTITEFAYREGDVVRKGAVVARISPAIREDILNAARLRGADSESMDFAIRQYREIPVVAPLAGVIAARNAETGDMVVQRQRLLEIQALSRLHVEVPVPEREMPLLRKGMTAEVRPDALHNEVYAGAVTRVYPRLDEKTRTGTVEVSLPAGAGSVLKTGMFARVSFVLEKADSALLVPPGAITLSAKGATVVFVVKDGVASARPVSVGLETAALAQVSGNLVAGDTVVTAGNEGLKEGAEVRVSAPKKEAAEGAAKTGERE